VDVKKMTEDIQMPNGDLLMTIEEIQKFLDDNNITLEEYLRENMITDEERKYIDKIWVDAIYKNLGEDTLRTGTGEPQNPL
jgi:hypothetical protein